MKAKLAMLCSLFAFVSYGQQSPFWSEDIAKNTAYKPTGNVIIGTADAQNSIFSVDGNIHTQKITLDMVNWPDYVFKEDYELPTLEEVKAHIEENGHLINIPSAVEMEAQGMKLGQMNKLLLEKIEELTLYTLKIREESELLQKRLDVLVNMHEF
ncbi:hypothetical protein D9V96_020455 [Zobellia laminariae]|uniref:hypothetical protein n=1 Tax=Zobellia laminariae TaxID=248906 RepID=UPI0012D9F671|nr:hypothetical protein [Zobellia laminariae]